MQDSAWEENNDGFHKVIIFTKKPMGHHLGIHTQHKFTHEQRHAVQSNQQNNQFPSTRYSTHETWIEDNPKTFYHRLPDAHCCNILYLPILQCFSLRQIDESRIRKSNFNSQISNMGSKDIQHFPKISLVKL